MSLSAVAKANGLNASLLRQWVKAHRATTAPAQTTAMSDGLRGPHPDAPATLVPVRVQHNTSVTGSDAIRVTLRRGQMHLEVAWPVSAATACGGWLCELLR